MSNQVESLNFENTAVAFESKSDWQLKKAKLIYTSFNSEFLVKMGSEIMLKALQFRLPVKGIIKSTVFEHFCGGENIKDSEKSLKDLASYGIGSILDYSVEGEKSEKGFDNAMKEILRTIEKASKTESIPFSVFKCSGISSIELLEKVQSGKELSPKDKEHYESFKNRVHVLCQKAYDLKVRIFIDAEETWIQKPIDDICIEMMSKFNKEECIVFNTYQMYLKKSYGNLVSTWEKGEKEGFYVGAKLVRGAYMEKERERAEEYSYEDPINPDKSSTDKMYDDALRFCVEKKERMSVCAGTHNESSTLLLAEEMDKNGIAVNDQRFWFAQLYGMSDHISFNLSKAGYNVAKYLPYGPIDKVMPYLVRRAEENKSVSGQSSRELTLINEELRRRKNS